MLHELIKDLQNAKNLEQAKLLQRFFKTGKGEYGEGDVFLGIKVPVTREIAKKYTGLNLKGVETLLASKIHEYRLAGLLILVDKFKKANEQGKGNIFNFYLKNTKNINNWDLVDLTSHKIVGEFLKEKKRDKLYELAQSTSLWEKRISIISCFAYIKDEDFKDALRISEMLLKDSHDLIHKAVGWVLREIGKKDIKVLEDFLRKHYKKMPRTMLRYAIEKFPEVKRKAYLNGKI
jgi:3-methyladenine DNA glycosylase AlkD